MSQTMQQEASPRKPGRKWLKGCGIGCASMLLVLALGGFFTYRWYTNSIFYQLQRLAQGDYEALMEPYEDMGFKKQPISQVMVIDQPISQKLIFTGQSVTLNADSSTDVAMIAQMGFITGKIDGDLYFTGQSLEIKAGAEVTGDVIVKAQVVVIRGNVRGQVTGIWQIKQQ